MNAETKMEQITAILSDFDGTLCPTSSIKYNYYNSNFIPRPIEDILCEISLSIPICIITSKDFDFIYPKTKKFAKILSCILGLETFVLNDRKQIKHDNNIPNKNNKSSLEDVIIRDGISCFDSETLPINSDILSEIVTYFEKEYKEINVEKKFLKGKQNLIGGITVDWRHYSNWTANKKKYREIIKRLVSIVLESVSKKRGVDISKEKLALCAESLFIQEYSTHPFIDLYVTKVNKGDAFEFVISKLSEMSNISGNIIYLGDSENDNPAFRKTDYSIGVISDNRLNPKLDCTYSIEFKNLAAFLKRLVDNGFDFSESLLNF
ncbi:MAG TPA: HAD hydrolase family protein [Candidatus Nitrosocosmicus sp.]|nr:HAD hydrolase family protein [Candidatus Nitrosocosmicus sp.]